MSYEENQKYRQSLLDELWPDDEQHPYENSSDDYKPSTSTEPDAVSEVIEFVIEGFRLDISEDEQFSDTNMLSPQYVNWEAVTGKSLKTFPFTTPSGCIDSVREMVDKAPIDFFNLFIDDEVINLMVVEINRYAAQKLNNLELLPHTRIRQWKGVTSQEMKKILGIHIWMGLCRFPNLASYWSKNVLYANNVKEVMSRNLLSCCCVLGILAITSVKMQEMTV
ncbi:Transposase IS4 [Popillia japonica]|uniref:Transposase IS4 n=1 Tax=Popillia japonica TaxID=7064 RepID=A0AAW1IYM0_POPJA